jgi:ABC-2 type transport system ATP-binding protein
VGLVPSGDRTFYLRISGFENLVFFGRLYGLRRREARARARELLEAVGLGEAGNARVGNYSHGMQKRLSVARALVPRPAVLLVDEATHDLDPAGAESVRALVRSLAVDGAAVVWTTQRVEEVRPLANRVTLLQKGQVCFAGSVPELMAQTLPRRFFVEVRNGSDRPPSAEALGRVLGGLGTISGPVAESGGGHYLLGLSEGAMLGEAVSRLVEANYDVLSCRHERPEIEDAFLHLTGERG